MGLPLSWGGQVPLGLVGHESGARVVFHSVLVVETFVSTAIRTEGLRYDLEIPEHDIYVPTDDHVSLLPHQKVLHYVALDDDLNPV
jgi:hypothetical protein